MKTELEVFLKAACGLIVLALFFVILATLSGCGTQGCGLGSGSCIGIGEPQPEPTCAEQVTDECVPEVIEAFCPETDECEYTAEDIIHTRKYYYQLGRDSVTCDDPCTSCDVPVVCPEPVCDEGDEDSDSDSDSGWDCDDSDSDSGWDCDDFADRVPGHRPIECRGKGHAK